MYNDTQKHQTQQLEQVITTVFTCRSVVKYNLSLGKEQKYQILQDIDTALEVLHACMLANMQPQPSSTDLPSLQTNNSKTLHVNDELSRSDASTHETLRALYRMYYTYLDINQQTNLQSFVSRFNEVISVLEDVQRLFAQKAPIAHDMHSSPVPTYSAVPTVAENLLQKVKVFICDLYYVFMDFIRTLSSVLQQNNVHLNTDKLPSLSVRQSARIRSIQLQRSHEHNPSPQDVQEAYEQLYQRRLQVEPQISEVTAFLEFLKGTLRALDTKVYQANEILAQTDTVSQLLSELLHIVADYEKITRTGE